MTKQLRIPFLMLLALLLAACGTIATPVWEAPEPSERPAEGQAVAVAPTRTIPPSTATFTPLPPTATDTPTEVPPTPTFTPEPPTATPTEALDPVVAAVRAADPARGETLFNQMYGEVGFSCAICHRVDSVDALVGPGLLGIAETAAMRVAGEVAEVYLYNSILHPNDYVVEGYPEGVMPATYEQIMSEQDIYDIIAYLMTLSE